MFLVTTNSVYGRKVKRILGLVTGVGCSMTGILDNVKVSLLRDSKGGEVPELEKRLDEARKKALEELKTKAKELGADAVSGVKFSVGTTEREKKLVVAVLASGTAVKLEKKGTKGNGSV